MRILVVAATSPEIAPFVSRLSLASTHAESGGQYVESCGQYVESGFSRIRQYSCAGHMLDVLVTGVGMVATAVWCTRALERASYDLALNVGVCGSFDPDLPPGSVAHVVSERLPELGAEDGERFLTAGEINLLPPDTPPFTGGALVNAAPPQNRILASLPNARGITVNTAHGDDRSIAEVTRRFAPQVESMEGAAFFYACLTRGGPFAEVRAVSNVVERRNRERWKMGEAIARLCETAHALIEAA